MYVGEPARSRRSKRWPVFVLAALALVVVSLLLFRTGEPTGTITTDRPGIGQLTRVQVDALEEGRGLAGVRLEVEQNGTVTVLAEEQQSPRAAWAFWGARETRVSLEAEVGKGLPDGLEPGQATLRLVLERAGSFFRRPDPVVVVRVLPVRFRPPSMAVLSDRVAIEQGGSAVVIYRVDPPALADGVEVGESRFRGFALPGGAAGERFALFAAPWDVENGSTTRLFAEDDLGNRVALPFLSQFRASPPAASTIEVSDSFMDRVVPAILAESELGERGDLLSTWLAINSELRQENDARLVALAQEARAEFLWRGAFKQQANSQVMDAFATKRQYFYQGRVVDQQTHLGYDLASRRRDAVTASNAGVVALAEYLGIYGRTVVLDHGFGLMSLYAHLSSIEVTPGETVASGAVLGRSGQTGLAGGDHLHFSVMVGGVPVDPVEWWDAFWVRTRIEEPLGLAGSRREP